MARARQLTFGAINIALPPPHRPDRYVALFEKVLGAAKKADLRGDWVGLLGEAVPDEDSRWGPLVRGEFYKYIELDKTRAWYSVARRRPADQNDLRKIIIPDDLKPHFQFLPFVFFARGHRLICVTRDGTDTLSIRQIAAILEVILRNPQIEREFGRVEITIEPSLETLDEILTMPRLRRLELDITPPNPDDFGDFEREIYEQLDEQNAGSMKVELTAAGGETLAPSESTKRLARVAQSNGKVVGIGGGRGQTKKLSTTEHPLQDKASYVPHLQLRSAVVFEKAAQIFNRLRNRN